MNVTRLALGTPDLVEDDMGLAVCWGGFIIGLDSLASMLFAEDLEESMVGLSEGSLPGSSPSLSWGKKGATFWNTALFFSSSSFLYV